MRWRETSRRRLAIVWVAALGLVAMASVEGAHAEDAKPPFFTWGTQEIGLSLGYGHGFDFAGSGLSEGKDVRELVILPYWQVLLTREPLESAWYKGRLALRSEGTFFVNFEPRSGFAGGLGLLLRYSFTHWAPVVPYFDGGAGFLGIDYSLLDQADGFAFQLLFGPGIRYDVNEHYSIELGSRLVHISNAGTQSPNGGIDTVQVLAGFAYRF
jgi:hypothetical protein